MDVCVFDVMADAIDRDVCIAQVGGTSLRKIRTGNPEDLNRECVRKANDSTKYFRTRHNRAARRADRIAIKQGRADFVYLSPYCY